jgi:hypothetical protein
VRCGSLYSLDPSNTWLLHLEDFSKWMDCSQRRLCSMITFVCLASINLDGVDHLIAVYAECEIRLYLHI